MSYVLATPEMVAAAANNLAQIGSTLSAANAAALAPTTGVLAAGADEVSAAVASLFSGHAQAYQTLGTQAAAFHERFIQALSTAAGAYGSAEASPCRSALVSPACLTDRSDWQQKTRPACAGRDDDLKILLGSSAAEHPCLPLTR